MIRKVVVSLHLALFILLANALPAAPVVGTGFTYQGKVTQNGQPLDGPQNFIFKLFSVDTAGTALGTQTVNNVPVANGLFNVTLNAAGEFGSNPFSGSKRWLEITVNGTPLAPRQEVTPVPNALFSSKPWETSGANVSFPGGNVAIGTTTPNKRLTVDGDMEVGVSSGDYHHIRIGGGNSSGFIFGHYPVHGDAIHMSYNYNVSPGGTPTIIAPDGATSRVSVAYGFVALATGGVNQVPQNRLSIDSIGHVGIGTDSPSAQARLDVRGDIKLGSSGQLFAVGGDENLRILRGAIAADGAVIRGQGFSVVVGEPNTFTITFTTPFSSTPTLTATMDTALTSFGRVAMIETISSSQVKIQTVTFNDDDTFFIRYPFHFIAVGPK